jgi:hypothetical protein
MSEVMASIECMFDQEWRQADDATVVSAIAECARMEAAAAARRLAAIGEYVSRHADGPTDCAYWSCDNWDAMAAETAAAQGISHAMASGQMYLAVALRDRLPQVAALFAAGTITARLASAIVWHTDLIKDPDTMRLVDTKLAEDAVHFGPMSVTKTAQAIDAVVVQYDPDALRRARDTARSREFVINQNGDKSGTAAVWGRLYATDAAVLDRRLSQMAYAVCQDDPRTVAQRRADALGALAAGADWLACGCGNSDCPGGAAADERAASVVIHVVADASAVDTGSKPDVPAERKPLAVVSGGCVIPPAFVAELARAGAKVRPVRHPADAPPESGYRPSAELERFIRCRDMTCRFPDCDRPAEFADIDHTVPYPYGPTQASNLKCLCRKHHLLKTFWSGWRDQQWSDGTIVWTSPTGHTYTTHPGSRLLFPALCLPTGELPTPVKQYANPGNRGVMMPTRHRTREQDRARRIDAERALNAARVVERNQPPPF